MTSCEKDINIDYNVTINQFGLTFDLLIDNLIFKCINGFWN